MIHIFYHPATGQIRQKSYSSQRLVPETPPGMEIMEVTTMDYGTLDPARHRVDLATGQVVPLPAKPSEFHYFDYADTKSWLLDTARAWEEVRMQRTKRLTECDWTTVPDAPLSEEKRAEWLVYRQALRDVPEQSDPMNIVWPTKPQ